MTTNDRLILKRVLDKLGLTENDVYTKWEGDRLVGLSLGYNKLNELPPEITNLKVLKYLGLSGNNLASSPGVLVSDEIGSRNAQTVYFIEQDKIFCGCFTGTLEEFERRVLWKYPEGKYHDEYMEFIKKCKEKR